MDISFLTPSYMHCKIYDNLQTFQKKTLAQTVKHYMSLPLMMHFSQEKNMQCTII